MREQFEKLPEIAAILNSYSIKFMNHSGWYEATKFTDFSQEQFINGAWYAFQEQQKRIDSYNLKILNFIKDLEKTHKDDKSNQFEYWRGFADCANSVVNIFNRDVGYLDQDIERKP